MLGPGTVLQGRYRLERLIGSGGMGEVYLATHTLLQAPVAIKRLLPVSADPQEQRLFEEQFRNEARVLATLKHPNLVAVTDSFQEDGHLFLVMEFIRGRTLREIVEEKPLSGPVALECCRRVIDALEYLHGQHPPVIFRDLKPENVMIDEDGKNLRLIDFGIAKTMMPGTRTLVGSRGVGTEGFAPPEQHGRQETDQRSDLYALGAILLFMVTGDVPPDAISRVTKRTNLPDPTDANDTVSEQTRMAICRLMELCPADRPASAAAARHLLGLEQRVTSDGACLIPTGTRVSAPAGVTGAPASRIKGPGTQPLPARIPGAVAWSRRR